MKPKDLPESGSSEEALPAPAPVDEEPAPPWWRVLPWVLAPGVGVFALSVAAIEGSWLIAAAGCGFLLAGTVAETLEGDESLLLRLVSAEPEEEPRSGRAAPRREEKSSAFLPPLPAVEEFPLLAEPEPIRYERDTSRIHFEDLGFELTRKATALKVANVKDRLTQKLDDDHLDKAFSVQASDLGFVHELVRSEEVGRALLDLKRLVGEAPLAVRLEDGRFLVDTPGCTREWCRDLFLERAEYLADRVGTMMVTRRILAGRGARPDAPDLEGQFEVLLSAGTGEAVCKICGEGIEHEVIRCRRCETPHHLSCWEYNDGCSVYGCRSRRHDGPAGA